METQRTSSRRKIPGMLVISSVTSLIWRQPKSDTSAFLASLKISSTKTTGNIPVKVTAKKLLQRRLIKIKSVERRTIHESKKLSANLQSFDWKHTWIKFATATQNRTAFGSRSRFSIAFPSTVELVPRFRPQANSSGSVK